MRYVGLGILGRNLHVFGKLLIAIEAPDSEAAYSKRKPAACGLRHGLSAVPILAAGLTSLKQLRGCYFSWKGHRVLPTAVLACVKAGWTSGQPAGMRSRTLSPNSQ